MTKVAVVTGSNKGIGFSTVRGLCKQFQGVVYLTARDVGRGQAAVAELEAEGLHPKFHQLDITDKQSCDALATFIKDTHGGIDILVNNAGMAYKGSSTAPFSEQAEVSVNTNYYGTLNVYSAMFPLLRPGARVVHVSSFTSHMAFNKCVPAVQERLKGATKAVAEVSSLMDQFVQDVKSGVHQSVGWANSGIGTSKLGISLMTPIQQRELDQDTSRPDIVVNAVCPGHVQTDMSSHGGNKTPDEGADTPLYAALLPPNTNIRGRFLSDRAIKPLY